MNRDFVDSSLDEPRGQNGGRRRRHDQLAAGAARPVQRADAGPVASHVDSALAQVGYGECEVPDELAGATIAPPVVGGEQEMRGAGMGRKPEGGGELGSSIDARV